MEIYAVIDTNVVLSAMLSHNPQAATVHVVRAIIEGKIIPLYNLEILSEYSDVLHRPQFKLKEDDVIRMVNNIINRGQLAERVHLDDNEVRDPKDVVFYEVALSKDGAYVVTGNIKDFPRKPIVVTPAEMITILENLGLIEKNTMIQ